MTRNYFKRLRSHHAPGHRPLTEYSPLQHFHLVNPGFTQSLHCQQEDFQSGRFGRVRPSHSRAAIAVGDRRCLRSPLPCQGFYSKCRNTGDIGRPVCRLGYTVLFSGHVFFELVETIGMSRDVVLIIGTFGYPGVGYSQLQSGVRTRLNRYPLVRMNSSPVVEIRADIDALYPQFGKPVADLTCHLSVESPWRCFRVASPEKQHLGILGYIGYKVGSGKHLSDRLHPPGMFGAPGPPFPAIRISYLKGETTE